MEHYLPMVLLLAQMEQKKVLVLEVVFGLMVARLRVREQYVQMVVLVQQEVVLVEEDVFLLE
jgi:hypothetical protein